MFVLSDETVSHGRLPWVTICIVMMNIIGFGLQNQFGDRVTVGYGMVPKEITRLRDLTKKENERVKIPISYKWNSNGTYTTQYSEKQIPIQHYRGPKPIFLTLVTSMFLHVGFLHLFGNMWFLGMFGRNVECAMGSGRFAVFYLLTGIAADVGHIAFNPTSVIPCVGASGAISGILGGYLAINPTNQLRVWIGWPVWIVKMPAAVFLGIWIVGQIIAACDVMEDGIVGGVAYWAHIFGFAAGFLFVKLYGIYLSFEIQKIEAAAASEPLEPTPFPSESREDQEELGQFMPERMDTTTSFRSR